MQELLELYIKTKKMYDKMYDIHFSSDDEIDDVILFIDKYWQKNHILTKSRELLDWQHHDKRNNRYNFVIARSRKDGEIHGLIGFILSSIYDSKIKTPIRWGAIWKVREDVSAKGLGVALKGYLEEKLPMDYIGGVGLSQYSKTIDTKLGEKMGKLSQYYLVNPDVDSFSLISNPQSPDFAKILRNGDIIFETMEVQKFESEAKGIEEFIMPYKSVGYYMNRYYRHPIYKYKFIAIKDNLGHLKAIFVYRKCSANNANNIFIVDYIGKESALRGTYTNFCKLLESENAECICFPCTGIDSRVLKSAGFVNRDDSNVVLPIYYEPFVQCNVDLDYHFWTKNAFSKEIIVKGDADQDRPNCLPEV